MAEKREHSTHVRLCDASDAMLDIAVEVALIAWGFYVLGAADK